MGRLTWNIGSMTRIAIVLLEGVVRTAVVSHKAQVLPCFDCILKWGQYTGSLACSCGYIRWDRLLVSICKQREERMF